jgi:hypothetical protein
MFAPPPAMPMLPRASCRMQEARTKALPVVCCVCPMHQMIVEGLFLAMVSAAVYTSPSETPQTSVTLSGVHFCSASALIFSMP